MRMSRRNTRQGKDRRRAERDRGQVTERKPKRPRTSDLGPRAVEDQAIQAARRPDGSDPRNSDEHGSERRADAEGGLIAMDLDEADLDTDADLENVDLDDFGDLDADDADLQATLTVLAVLADDISGVAEVTDELADDVDLPAAQVAVAGATADPVKDYLKQIGKVPLLNAEQEVELAKRIEAGLFAEEKLAEGARH